MKNKISWSKIQENIMIGTWKAKDNKYTASIVRVKTKDDEDCFHWRVELCVNVEDEHENVLVGSGVEQKLSKAIGKCYDMQDTLRDNTKNARQRGRPRKFKPEKPIEAA